MLSDYIVNNDNFEPERCGFLDFPCNVCIHRNTDELKAPCATCGHNVNAVKALEV